jgi:hypothetical protein
MATRSDRMWGGILSGLGQGLQTFIALQEAEKKSQEEKARWLQEYALGKERLRTEQETAAKSRELEQARIAAQDRQNQAENQLRAEGYTVQKEGQRPYAQQMGMQNLAAMGLATADPNYDPSKTFGNAPTQSPSAALTQARQDRMTRGQYAQPIQGTPFMLLPRVPQEYMASASMSNDYNTGLNRMASRGRELDARLEQARENYQTALRNQGSPNIIMDEQRQQAAMATQAARVALQEAYRNVQDFQSQTSSQLPEFRGGNQPVPRGGAPVVPNTRMRIRQPL